jgi:hypothetical protein
VLISMDEALQSIGFSNGLSSCTFLDTGCLLYSIIDTQIVDVPLIKQVAVRGKFLCMLHSIVAM